MGSGVTIACGPRAARQQMLPGRDTHQPRTRQLYPADRHAHHRQPHGPSARDLHDDTADRWPTGTGTLPAKQQHKPQPPRHHHPPDQTPRKYHSQTSATGINRFTFNGRIGAHKLTPGTYQLSATPTANGRTGATQGINLPDPALTLAIPHQPQTSAPAPTTTALASHTGFVAKTPTPRRACATRARPILTIQRPAIAAGSPAES